MKFHLLFALFSTVFIVVANGEAQKSRTCRIVYPERPRDAPKVAFLYDGVESHSVTLPSMSFSNVINLPPGNITLLLTPNEIPKTITSEELRALAAKAPKIILRESIQHFYILLSPDPSNEILPVKPNLLNVEDDKFKKGETLWFNLTNHRILAKLGSGQMVLAPKNQTVSESPLPTSGYYMAEFGYQLEAKGDILRLGEQHWFHDADSRHLGFVVNRGGQMPKIYFYRDFR